MSVLESIPNDGNGFLDDYPPGVNDAGEGTYFQRPILSCRKGGVVGEYSQAWSFDPMVWFYDIISPIDFFQREVRL